MLRRLVRTGEKEEKRIPDVPHERVAGDVQTAIALEQVTRFGPGEEVRVWASLHGEGEAWPRRKLVAIRQGVVDMQ